MRPPAIQRAVIAMYLGAVVGVVHPIVTVVIEKSLIGTAASEGAPSSAVKAASTGVIVGGVIAAIIVGGLWLWMAWKNGQGRSWARILSTVLFGLATVATLINISGIIVGSVPALLILLEWIIGLFATIFMYQGGQYYSAVTAQRNELNIVGTAYPPTPGYPPQQPGPGYPPQPPASGYGQQPPPAGFGQPPSNPPY